MPCIIWYSMTCIMRYLWNSVSFRETCHSFQFSERLKAHVPLYRHLYFCVSFYLTLSFIRSPSSSSPLSHSRSLCLILTYILHTLCLPQVTLLHFLMPNFFLICPMIRHWVKLANSWAPSISKKWSLRVIERKCGLDSLIDNEWFVSDRLRVSW